MEMKMKHLGVLLGLLHIIYAVPSMTGYTGNDPEPGYNRPEDYIQEEGEPGEDFKEEVRKYFKENNGPQMAFKKEVEIEGDDESHIQEEGEPSEDFKKEVQEYFTEHSRPQMAFRQEQAEVEGGHAIRQGDTIALQTHTKERWLACSGDVCSTSDCPGAIFEGADWNRCWGEVFQIYRPTPGEIRSGDLIGIHFPRQHGNWLGCSGHHCRKTSCPGHPSTRYGFSKGDRWYQCYGEVYRIFAYRKSRGAIINSGDDIMLYFIVARRWVDGEGTVQAINDCPGYEPPRQDKFDHCAHELFTIIKR